MTPLSWQNTATTSDANTATEGNGYDKTDLSDLSGKVEKIEAEPGNRWKTLVEKVILLVTAAVVGYILARVGL